MDLSQILAPLLGAGAGFLTGGPEPPGLSPQERRIWRMLIERFQERHRYSNSPTLSTPVERQSLAQAQGLQSETAGRSRAGLFGQQGASDFANNPMIGRQLSNLGAAEMAQANALTGQFALQGLQDRQNVKSNVLPSLLGQAAGVAGNPTMPGQQGGFSALMPFLQQAAYQWGNRPSSGSNQRMVNGQPVDEMGNALNPSPNYGNTGTQFRIPIGQWTR